MPAPPWAGCLFTNGLVFDSRLWASPPDPVQSSDSGVDGMQHMAVMKTFALAQQAAPVTSAMIYVLSGPHGSISPTNAVVNFGQNKTFAITAATYYVIADVKVDGVSVGATSAYTFANVTKHHSLAATFAVRLATNGVPAWWLASHGWTSNFDNAALGDQDGDGAFTWQEYVAGTIPTNELSVLRMATRRAAAPVPAILSWPSATGRVYGVELRTNALLGGWTSEAGDLSATPPINVFTSTMEQAEGLFYRVRVRQP